MSRDHFLAYFINPRACTGVWYLSCLSVCQLPVMAASNGHNSETTSSRTTKRGIGMGSVAISDNIQLKSLSMKHEARKVTEMV